MSALQIKPTQEQITAYLDAFYRTGSKAKAYREVFGENRQVDYSFHSLPEVQEQLSKDWRGIEENNPAIMSADEILMMYSRIARGEEADQFGLEATLADRLTALKELGKRCGLASEVIEIKQNESLAERMKNARERALNGEKQITE